MHASRINLVLFRCLRGDRGHTCDLSVPSKTTQRRITACVCCYNTDSPAVQTRPHLGIQLPEEAFLGGILLRLRPHHAQRGRPRREGNTVAGIRSLLHLSGNGKK